MFLKHAFDRVSLALESSNLRNLQDLLWSGPWLLSNPDPLGDLLLPALKLHVFCRVDSTVYLECLICWSSALLRPSANVASMKVSHPPLTPGASSSGPLAIWTYPCFSTCHIIVCFPCWAINSEIIDSYLYIQHLTCYFLKELFIINCLLQANF